MLVAVDYFTKWLEAKALANIRDVDVKKFVWKNIVTRFGVSDSLISNTDCNLIVKLFALFVVISASKTGIPLQCICKAMAKLKLPARQL